MNRKRGHDTQPQGVIERRGEQHYVVRLPDRVVHWRSIESARAIAARPGGPSLGSPAVAVRP